MTRSPIRTCVLCIIFLSLIGGALAAQRAIAAAEMLDDHDGARPTMQVQYLEIVTPAVEETCAALSQAHGVEFGEPIAALGNARTADLIDGGRIGVRAPLRDTEVPVVRPYILVDDIEAAVEAAQAAGGQVAVPPMELPGQGTFAIYILGGIEHGLWQR